MNIIIGLVLLIMILIFLSTAVKICVLNRSDRLKYLKNFKKGKCILIYIAAIPLHWVAYYESVKNIWGSFFMAIKSSLNLLILKFDYSDVSFLMNENMLFNIAMIVCFILVLLNAILFTLTLTGQRIENYFRRLRIRFFSKKVYVIVGLSSQNKAIIKSINLKESQVLLIAPINTTDADYAYVAKVCYINTQHPQKLGKVLNQMFKRYDNKTINVIINDENDATNLICVKQIADIIERLDISKYGLDESRGLSAYVFGKPENSSSFNHLVEKSNGCIHYLNKYKLIALDFNDKYPLTKFMDDSCIDYQTGTLKNDITLNCVFVGFGKTNQQLYLTSVANNQFTTIKNKKLEEVKVNYWIYDKSNPRNDKNLNHNYFRFLNELSPDDKDDYLPLPEKPANEEFFSLNINDYRFYDSLKNHLLSQNNKKPFNYIIIAYGNDMENLDFAEKISAKLREWNLNSVTKVFVKIRDSVLCKTVIDNDFAISSNFITFASEADVVYNINKIVSEKKELLARHRHLAYWLKDGMNVDEEQEAKNKALEKWYKFSHVQRESNVYGCLSIRLKLQLMGFDYTDINDNIESANDLYQKEYEKGDPIIYDENIKSVKGKKHIVYKNDMIEGSLRYNMAYLEHQRWNAYMLTCGFVPSTIEQIKADDNKNFVLRRHGNLTTFAGLKSFAKIEAVRRNVSEEETDVIRYDYQLMDDLVWLLTNTGYKIIKR